MLNNIVETIVNNIVRSTAFFGHDNRVVHHCSTNKAVTTCAIFRCVREALYNLFPLIIFYAEFEVCEHVSK